MITSLFLSVTKINGTQTNYQEVIVQMQLTKILIMTLVALGKRETIPVRNLQKSAQIFLSNYSSKNR